MWTYKATRLFITAFKRLVGFRLRVSGSDHLPDAPTLFLVNHFTRLETIMVPYAVDQAVGRPVKSLATASIFRGLLARYLAAVGVVSVRDPRRNRMIVGDLMTGSGDWVIYPEGGLIKSKKTTDRGRLCIERPDRTGAPHTGAAMLALKSQMCKARYVNACSHHDERRRIYYERQFDVSSPQDLSPQGTVIVPVTITYHSYSPGTNLIHRVARLLTNRLDPRVEEELQVEGSILLGRTEMNIHFGEPIEVSSYLDRTTRVARQIVGAFSEEHRTNFGLRRQATRLTSAAMQSVYAHVELNFEHLFCYGLTVVRQETVRAEEFRKAMYLVVIALQKSTEMRLHPELRNGVASLVTGDRFEPLDRAEARAVREQILRIDSGQYQVDRGALHGAYDFHRIRLDRMVRVLANEVEANPSAAATVRRFLNLSGTRIAKRVLQTLCDQESRSFSDDCQNASGDDWERPSINGEPFLLKARGSRRGIVLVHGYLSCPLQMRPLAEHLVAAGWNVYAVRLPGHGTAPQHLADIRWHQWHRAVLRGCAVMRQQCECVAIGGFSLGGVLALLAAASLQPRVDAVVSINAPFRLRDRRTWLIHPVLAWRGMVERAGFGDGQSHRENDSEDPEINYPEYSLASVRELRRAVTACRGQLGRVHAPSLFVQATNDPLVDPTGTHQAMARATAAHPELIEPTCDRHVIVRGDDCSSIFNSVSAFLERAVAKSAVEAIGRVAG